MKYDESKLLIFLVATILGFLLASQFKPGKVTPRGILTFQSYQQMSLEIAQLNNEISKLENKKSDLENKVYRYQYNSESVKDTIDQLEEELKDNEFNSGFTDVKGPGITLSISDSLFANEVKNRDIAVIYIVHDDDLKNLIWELKNAGAEAISINGQRIIGSTEFTCEGPSIRVNNELLVPPFNIKAIGDPKTLSFALDKDGSIFKEMEDYRKMQVSVREEKSITIPKYGSAINFNYAKTVK
ncbi:MAG: DUF881 domain-containing protein [Clostridiales bacterium]|nr:DUF881 domain-containing protein [Clostridiales bacterium]